MVLKTSDNDLQAPVKLFGRDMTKQAALMLILLNLVFRPRWCIGGIQITCGTPTLTSA
jgi:hypothetical protein